MCTGEKGGNIVLSETLKGIPAGILGLGGCLLTLLATAAEKPDPAKERAWIERRIEEVQPTTKERRFDTIGWASGIRAAERLARDNGRPVFLFSNVGQMDVGRC
jgi:hypothetical protein